MINEELVYGLFIKVKGPDGEIIEDEHMIGYVGSKKEKEEEKKHLEDVSPMNGRNKNIYTVKLLGNSSYYSNTESLKEDKDSILSNFNIEEIKSDLDKYGYAEPIELGTMTVGDGPYYDGWGYIGFAKDKNTGKYYAEYWVENMSGPIEDSEYIEEIGEHDSVEDLILATYKAKWLEENLNESWLAVILKDKKGNKQFHQFESEEELRYFLDDNPELSIEKKERSIEEDVKETKLSDVRVGQSFKVLDDVYYCDVQYEDMFEDDEELLDRFLDAGFKLVGTDLYIQKDTELRYEMSQSVDVYKILMNDFTFDVGEWTDDSLNTSVEIIDKVDENIDKFKNELYNNTEDLSMAEEKKLEESIEELRKKYPNAKVLPFDKERGAFILSKEELDDWEY